MNLSLFTLILHLLPTVPMLEADIELEVKTLASNDDGMTKVKQTIALLEDMLKKLEAAIA